MNHIEPHEPEQNEESKEAQKNKKCQRMTKPALTFIVLSCIKWNTHFTFQAVTITLTISLAHLRINIGCAIISKLYFQTWYL